MTWGNLNPESLISFDVPQSCLAYLQIRASENELLKERDCVGHLIPGSAPASCEITVDTMLPGEN